MLSFIGLSRITIHELHLYGKVVMCRRGGPRRSQKKAYEFENTPRNDGCFYEEAFNLCNTAQIAKSTHSYTYLDLMTELGDHCLDCHSVETWAVLWTGGATDTP